MNIQNVLVKITHIDGDGRFFIKFKDSVHPSQYHNEGEIIETILQEDGTNTTLNYDFIYKSFTADTGKVDLEILNIETQDSLYTIHIEKTASVESMDISVSSSIVDIGTGPKTEPLILAIPLSVTYTGIIEGINITNDSNDSSMWFSLDNINWYHEFIPVGSIDSSPADFYIKRIWESGTPIARSIINFTFSVESKDGNSVTFILEVTSHLEDSSQPDVGIMQTGNGGGLIEYSKTNPNSSTGTFPVILGGNGNTISGNNAGIIGVSGKTLIDNDTYAFNNLRTYGNLTVDGNQIISGDQIINGNLEVTSLTIDVLGTTTAVTNIGVDVNGNVVENPITSTLVGLTDTNISSPSDGQSLTYDTATSKWINSTVAGATLWEAGSGTNSIKMALSSNYASAKYSLVIGNYNKASADNSIAAGSFVESDSTAVAGSAFVFGTGNSTLKLKSKGFTYGLQNSTTIQYVNEGQFTVQIGTNDCKTSIISSYSGILGGTLNEMNGTNSVILGGYGNIVSDDSSAIIGGQLNIVDEGFSAILGGYTNEVKSGANASVLIGGHDNTIWSNYGAIIGGNNLSLNHDNMVGVPALILMNQTPPSTAAQGMMFFNNTDKHFYGYNGTAWKQLDN